MIKYDDFLEIVKKYGAENAEIVVFENGESTCFTFGYKDKEENDLLKEDDIFRIASISKTVLAIGAMKLKEDGKLDLDEDISNYLGFLVRNPHFPNNSITTRMLMTQTSSITDGFDDEDLSYDGSRVDGYNGVNGRVIGIPLKEMLTPSDSKYYSDLTFLKNAPGEKFVYSNFGCGILACIIEKISGMNYDLFMKKILFDKLNLDASYYPNRIKKQERIVSLYMNDGKRTGQSFVERSYPDLPLGEAYLGPAGGLFISMKDLSKIMCSFFVDKYKVLKDETIKEMLSINWEGDEGEYQKKALQMIVLDGYVPFRLYGHFGSAYGLRSMMLFNPEKKCGVCFAGSGYKNQQRIKNIPGIHYELINKIW